VAAASSGHISTARQLRLAAIDAEPDRLYKLHAQNTINDQTMRIIEVELDEREILSSASPLRGQALTAEQHEGQPRVVKFGGVLCERLPSHF
jgi:hypothetical protein